jgi:hypothetical protein
MTAAAAALCPEDPYEARQVVQAEDLRVGLCRCDPA